MVTLPPEFIAIKYPGYFWNTIDNTLYSVKITGTLKPMKLHRRWNGRMGGYVRGTPDETNGYSLSKKGRPYFMSLKDLKALTPKDTVFPIYKQLELPI
jgi:hypothetical protein